MARTQAMAVALVVCLVGVDAGAQESRPGSGWVVLPVDEYGALRARGRPATPVPPAAALTRIDYRLRADGDVVLGQARLTLETTGPGPVVVPLPGGLAVREARVAGRPAMVDAGPRPPCTCRAPATRPSSSISPWWRPTPATPRSSRCRLSTPR
ncbi:MAG: hypothetical protein R2708_18750 [Vicinamibacterales bacterium]